MPERDVSGLSVCRTSECIQNKEGVMYSIKTHKVKRHSNFTVNSSFCYFAVFRPDIDYYFPGLIHGLFWISLLYQDFQSRNVRFYKKYVNFLRFSYLQMLN